MKGGCGYILIPVTSLQNLLRKGIKGVQLVIKPKE